jgi:hypothetical protein
VGFWQENVGNTDSPIFGVIGVDGASAQRVRRGQRDRRDLARAARPGADMPSKYKETSPGGLVVDFVEG